MTDTPIHAIHLTVNGIDYPVAVAQGRNLLSVIRTEIGLTGTKEGCDDCECGACMVLLDGQPVNSCSYLAVQAQGRAITTVEGLADGDALSLLQRNLLDEGGVQCGFCTPGMLLSATARADRRVGLGDLRPRLAAGLRPCGALGPRRRRPARRSELSCRRPLSPAQRSALAPRVLSVSVCPSTEIT